MKIIELNPAPYNPRDITDKEIAMLKKSMAEFGDLSGVVVNKNTGAVVGGHQRLKVLPEDCEIVSEPFTDETGTIAIGHIETSRGRWHYREVAWDIQKEKAANIAANKHGGSFNIDKLQELFSELDVPCFDVELTGFESMNVINNETVLPEKEEEIKYYKQAHILISFHPDKFNEIKSQIETIMSTPGVEIEQSAN